MALRLAARLVGLLPSKILDLQENDTTDHTEDISAYVPSETVAILFVPIRISGTGIFRTFPRSSASSFSSAENTINTVTIQDQELKWKNSVANDDWDIYLIGYFVQKRTR